MNKVFDCLNSKKFFGSKYYDSALHQKNLHVEKTLSDAIPYFNSIEKIDNSGRISRPPCFDGICQTLRGILCLFKEEQKQDDDIYILTSKLTQDALENLFGAIRQKCGYNVNPTARVFRTTFRSNIINCLMKPVQSANYEEAADNNLKLQNSPILNECPSSTPSKKQEESFFSGQDILSEETLSSSSDGEENLEQCAIKYYAGYLVKKTLKKFECNNCKNNMLSKNIFFTDKNEILIFHRLYKNIIKTSEIQGLKAPSLVLYKSVKKAIDIFEITFPKICYKKNLCSNILKLIEKKINFTSLTNSVDSCKEHIYFLFKTLVEIKLYKECKTRSLKAQNVRKLKILQNQ